MLKISITIVATILIGNLKLNSARFVNNNNNNHNSVDVLRYTNQDDFGHKCLIEVPTIYLEFDRKYQNITEGTTDKDYYSKIEVCCNGYKRSKFDWYKCVPMCKNCEHGVCIEPENCQCFPNYVKNHEGKCTLTCPVNCDNGRCKSDGTCKCNQGYKLDETQKFCQPICNRNSNCEHTYQQYCSAPNTCSCIEGYHVNRYGCEPICEHNCGINGTCDSPNVCRCQNGAILKHGICQAKCYQKCENGLCIASNRCICFEGFEYDARTTMCVPQKHLLRNFSIEKLF